LRTQRLARPPLAVIYLSIYGSSRLWLLSGAGLGHSRRWFNRQGFQVGFESGPVLGLKSHLKFLLKLASMQRRLKAGPAGAEVGSTPGLLAGRVDLDMSVRCPHHSNQLSLGAHFSAGDTGPLGDVSGFLRLMLPGRRGTLVSARLRWLWYWHM
jgi:hypothetical protein